ncbi:imm11 family protein [Litchfieldia salsa]|uniref:Immunity MXAN-0049 protein domain-containing protein n=1 Tax=Litchfieldia salsa TaxID=930152 RepID=A0A1H0PW64_9BACI|nr:DUF1629 domain-containing protein [Litchfieldia salsa]SDP09392.1 hypothetical protein SAMN05216565_101495 [Litchfieldia salsa]
MTQGWNPIHINKFKEGNVSDFPAGLLSVPTFSERAINVLGDLFAGKVELLPLLTEVANSYYAGNVVNVLDCIDEDHAEVRLFDDGQVMKYTRYAFLEDKIKDEDLFKILVHDSKRILKTKVFVSDRFREAVLEAGLKGFEFIEVWDSTNYEKKISTVHEEKFLQDHSIEWHTFELASELVRKHNKIVLSGEWAIRLGNEQQIQIGHMQEDGTYLWLNPIYYPPVFIEMKWRILE